MEYLMKMTHKLFGNIFLGKLLNFLEENPNNGDGNEPFNSNTRANKFNINCHDISNELDNRLDTSS